MTDFGEAIDRELSKKAGIRAAQEAQRRIWVEEHESTLKEIADMCEVAIAHLRAARAPSAAVVTLPSDWGFRSQVQRDGGRVAWALGDWMLTSTCDLWIGTPLSVAEFVVQDPPNQRRILKAFRRGGFDPDDLITPTPRRPLIAIDDFRDGFGLSAPGLNARLLHLPINDGQLSVIPADGRDRGPTVPRFADMFASRLANTIDRT